ncbi:MAG: RNA polymerase sigma-70 factor [Bacteroidota bacterium]
MFIPKRKSTKPDIRTEAGFTAIYEQYVEYVYSVCYRYLSDINLSEDTASKIFTSLWERRDILYKETWNEDSWRRYLAKAVKHKVYDYFRSREQSNNYISTIVRELHPAENTTEREIYLGELAEQVSHYVNQLPPKCKEVFLLSRENGLSHKEISKLLSISNNAIKKHITRALNHLRENLPECSLPERSTG